MCQPARLCAGADVEHDDHRAFIRCRALAAAYPFTKRYTHFPQVLGAAFGWAVPMAFTALQEQILAVAWVPFTATVISGR